MALNIQAHWHQPLNLVRVNSGAIYGCPDIHTIPIREGAYVFGRKHGRKCYPLYIGQARNLQSRVKQHLNSVRLMTGLLEAPAGNRFVVVCEVEFKKGQNHQSVLDALEGALIAHALAENHQLLQIQGTRFPSHTIQFTGNRTSESIAPRYLMLRA